jgi:signal transduction histidine kinase
LVIGRSEERAWIRIEDQGPGIPEEIRHRLFERFVQGGSDGRRAAGSGLGLAISKGLVEALGGEIQLESSPERGTRVTIELPLAGPAQSR